MKVRKDFVTNSSSSSFIIAKHKDCTIDEIKTMLYGLKDRIRELLYECDGEYDSKHMADIKHAYDDDNMDKAIDLAIIDIAENLNKTYKYDLTLDDWNVRCTTASNEDCLLFECALYDFGHLMDTEHLKLNTGD